MRLYSYVVRRDFGFAPNPFHGVCTLATCKAQIRRTAQVGDWVVGTGSAAKRYRLGGRLVYAMQVSEAMSFDEYWDDKRFACKRPSLHASLKDAYGDNIYHRNPGTGVWMQEDSHHSKTGGVTRQANIDDDTRTNRMLVGQHFVYWGGYGPAIPAQFRDFKVKGNRSHDICVSGQGRKCIFPPELVESFVKWVTSQGLAGYIGDPAEFLLTHGLEHTPD